MTRKRADNLDSGPTGDHASRSRQLLAALCPPGASGGLVVAELLPRRELALPVLAVPAPGGAAAGDEEADRDVDGEVTAGDVGPPGELDAGG